MRAIKTSASPALRSIATLFMSYKSIICVIAIVVSSQPASGFCQDTETRLADKTRTAAIDEMKARIQADFAIRLNDAQKTKIIEAFREAHGGYSPDEVILNDELQLRFLAACETTLPELKAVQINWALMNLRKAGKLSEIKTTEQNRVDATSFRPLGEIATRQLQDRYGVSTDQIMTSPELRAEFENAARQIDELADLYAVRKAAFQLRKTRLLKPELITRIADWGRKVTARSAAEFKADLNSIPEAPGIYVFCDSTGYLYVGESDNLRRRLAEHLDESDRRSLAGYLTKQGCENITLEIHTFEEGSRIGELAVRRAYESELIRSRNPRFNIRP